MGTNPRSRRQQRIASDIQNRRPFTGTINADTDPETGHYVVRSYDTPIGRSFHHPETGELIRSLSGQQFSPTTTQHQYIVRQHLAGEEGPPMEEQSWTRRDWGYMSGGSNSPESGEHIPARPRLRPHGQPQPAFQSSPRVPEFHSADAAPGMLVSELLGHEPGRPEDAELFHIPERERMRRVFNDRREGDYERP